jgi:hypothetical protein
MAAVYQRSPEIRGIAMRSACHASPAHSDVPAYDVFRTRQRDAVARALLEYVLNVPCCRCLIRTTGARPERVGLSGSPEAA